MVFPFLPVHYAVLLCIVSVLRGRLLELGGLENGPTEDKTIVVFHTLDCLIAQLGIYKEVVKTCRDELFSEFASVVFIIYASLFLPKQPQRRNRSINILNALRLNSRNG